MGDGPLWLSEAGVVQLASLEEAIDILASAYSPASQRDAQNMRRAHAHHGETILHAVGGMLPGAGVAGTKTWIYSPAGASPLLIVFSLADGSLLGIVEAFALGQWRTAATSGLGTRLLAREDAATLALIGTGKQALSQARAVAAVRDIRSVRVFGRDRERLEAFGARAAELLDAEISLHIDLADAMRGADVVTTITRAAEPFLDGALLEPGMHVNAVGAIVPSRSELTTGAVARCDVVVADSPEQARSDSGELRAAAEAGDLDWPAVLGLADVVADPGRGRNRPGQITLFKALGLGISDVALGAELIRRARTAGVGIPLPATPDPHSIKPRITRSEAHA